MKFESETAKRVLFHEVDLHTYRMALADPEVRRQIWVWSVFSVVWLTLVVAPFWAFSKRNMLASCSPMVRRKRILLCAVLIVLSAIILESSWSFRGVAVDTLVVCGGYFSYATLICSLSAIRPKWVGYTLTSLGGIPLVLGMAIAMTVMGLMVAIDSVVPWQSGDLERGYAYKVSYYGGAFASHNGAEMRILYRPTFPPMLEHEVFQKDFRDCNPGGASVQRVGNHFVVSCEGPAESVKAD